MQPTFQPPSKNFAAHASDKCKQPFALPLAVRRPPAYDEAVPDGIPFGNYLSFRAAVFDLTVEKRPVSIRSCSRNSLYASTGKLSLL